MYVRVCVYAECVLCVREIASFQFVFVLRLFYEFSLALVTKKDKIMTEKT